MNLSDLGLLISEIDTAEDGTALDKVDKAIADCEARLRSLRIIRKGFVDSEPAEETPKPRTRKPAKSNGEAVSA